MARFSAPIRWADGSTGTRFMQETYGRDKVNITVRNNKLYMYTEDGDTGRAASLVFTMTDVRDFVNMLTDAVAGFDTEQERICRSCDKPVRQCICEMADQLTRYIET